MKFVLLRSLAGLTVGLAVDIDASLVFSVWKVSDKLHGV
jgi:hypothetical protein